jgi:DNA-cytosine methyltransferase
MKLNNVLSLFDGISCGQIALNRAGVLYQNYYSSEIHKNAMKVVKKNYPNTIFLGDINFIENDERFPKKIDLLLAGSPCQGFSLSGKQLNFEDPRSKLYFKFLEIMKKYKPKFVLLENVLMKKEYMDVITNTIGIQPIKIDSRLFSAQSRKRLYWTNIPIDINKIVDKHILLVDVIENATENQLTDSKARKQTKKILESSKYKDNFLIKRDTQGRILVMRPDGLKIQRIGRVGELRHKSEIITVATQPYIWDGRNIRKVSPLEAERLQTVPENYTYLEDISNLTRYKMLGNGWTVDVIAFILEKINSL